jgi:hypothetical protein
MPSAERYFKKIKEKPLKLAFKDAIDKILYDPYIGQPKTGDLAGFYCYDVFYKNSNYEIAYIIKEMDNKLVIVVLAGTRENFYEELKRYIR